MSDWGGGYVTDIPYSIGYYRTQSPIRMAIAATIGGTRAPIPGADDPVTMLELGCGYGYTSLAFAASNPNWKIVAVDFNPTHIAEARDWAAQAGITNVTFVEGDFARWEDDPILRDLPQMDFVTMHGIWSWIPAPAKAGIVRLLGKKVAPGGLVHVSYNTAAGWIDMMPPARLIREAGHRTVGRSNVKAQAGLRLIQDLLKAEAHVLHNRPGVTSRMKMLERANLNYLAHEFMNEEWAPCYFADVAATMAEAKLEWIAASDLTENFPELMMNEAQREIVNRYEDPIMREMIKDVCTPRALRHDIFVRGTRHLSVPERNQVLMDISLTLTQPVSTLPASVDVAAGKAELNEAFYGPIVRGLVNGPRRMRDLLELPDIVGRRDNPSELIAILSTAGMAEPTIRPGAPPGPEAIRFNELTARKLFGRESPARPIGLACQATGVPIHASLFQLFIIDGYRRGITSVEGLTKMLDVPQEQEENLAKSVEEALNGFLPVMRAAGVF
jgi:SAM-dependent methyltransferase